VSEWVPGTPVCPACGSDVATPDDVALGEVLFCENCGAELEVIGTEPVRLDLFEEEEK
jgi:alpha-aminoadipate carrier protein LysW